MKKRDKYAIKNFLSRGLFYKKRIEYISRYVRIITLMNKMYEEMIGVRPSNNA